MQLVFLIIQMILAVAIIGAVLLQKNSGDGLGSLGGGGMNGGNIISGRSTASFLTKATTILMFCFMANSLILGNLYVRKHKGSSIITKEASVQPNENEATKAPKNQVPTSE